MYSPEPLSLSYLLYGVVNLGYRDSHKKFYWILARDPDPPHKPFLIAGGDDESSAREKALDMLPGLDFEIRGLRTRNLSRASQMIRGKRLEDTHDLRTAKEKLGHERSVRRMIQKRRQSIDY